MSASHTAYALYGVRLSNDTDWRDLESDPGQHCNNGVVGYFSAGRHDEEMLFLAHQVNEVEVGQYVMYTRDRIFEERKFQRAWDDALVATANRLGLLIVDGPGWIVVQDEGR